MQGEAVDWEQALRASVVVHTVTPQATFGNVLNRLSAHRLHRLYVTDAVEKTTGIVTLTDVLRVVLGDKAPPPVAGPAGGLPASTDLDGGTAGDNVAEGGAGGAVDDNVGSHMIDVDSA